MEQLLTVLLIGDNPEDVYSIRRMFNQSAGPPAKLESVETLSEGIQVLREENIKLVLLDFSLTGNQDVESLVALRPEAIDIPIIVLTGLEDENVALQAIALGAQDYINKSEMDSNSLWRAIRYAIERNKMIKELTKANRKILNQQKSVIEEERLKILLQLSGATAHELSQPITNILNHVHFIRTNTNGPDALEKYLGMLEASATQLSGTLVKLNDLRHDVSEPTDLETDSLQLNEPTSILAVESSDNDYNLVHNLLQNTPNIQLVRSKTIREAFELLKKSVFHLILLDFQLPDGNSFDMLSKMSREKIDTPVVIITGKGNELISSQLIQAGAYDYLPKSRVTIKSLSRTIFNALEKAKLKRQLKETYDRLTEMSTRDELTGLYNRRFFIESLERETSRALRYGTDLNVCMLDLDHFKKINDSYGHLSGDHVLSETARLLQQSIRKSDIPCRYGGEEFAIIFPQLDADNARTASEKLRNIVAEHTFNYDSYHMSLTLSIGIASVKGKTATAIQLIKEADRALYQAKNQGRNRTVISTS